MMYPILSRALGLSLTGVLSFGPNGSVNVFGSAHAQETEREGLQSDDLDVFSDELQLTRDLSRSAGAGDEIEAMLTEGVLVAQNEKSTAKSTAKSAASSKPSSRSRGKASRPSSRSKKAMSSFSRAQALAAAGKYQEASSLLYKMSRSREFRNESAQIKYILGLMLFELKLNQAAAFVFYDVVREESRRNPKSRYLRQSLEKLVVAADALDSDVLLRYATRLVNENEFPAANRDLLYYRTGEIKLAERNYAEAIRQFQRVKENSPFYPQSRYRLALALTEAGDLARAERAFDDLARTSASNGVTDINRVSAVIGQARVLYQKKEFQKALDLYRQIPRDTPLWHQALFEMSWAMVRDGQFRSALSVFHTLHSSFYEDHFQPESLLVRAIVYLYICRHDEMEKVLNLFQKIYQPVYQGVQAYLGSVQDPVRYYRDLVQATQTTSVLKSTASRASSSRIPELAARYIKQEGDVRRTLSYLRKLEEEKARMDGLLRGWKNASIGKYSQRIVDKRIDATRALAGKQIRQHMLAMEAHLRTLTEQDGLLRFEMLSSKRESLRKEIAGKGITKAQVDAAAERSYYIQNGYEYWPFRGEYWLDELGNYHYVGVRACE